MKALKVYEGGASLTDTRATTMIKALVEIDKEGPDQGLLVSGQECAEAFDDETFTRTAVEIVERREQLRQLAGADNKEQISLFGEIPKDIALTDHLRGQLPSLSPKMEQVIKAGIIAMSVQLVLEQPHKTEELEREVKNLCLLLFPNSNEHYYWGQAEKELDKLHTRFSLDASFFIAQIVWLAAFIAAMEAGAPKGNVSSVIAFLSWISITLLGARISHRNRPAEFQPNISGRPELVEPQLIVDLCKNLLAMGNNIAFVRYQLGNATLNDLGDAAENDKNLAVLSETTNVMGTEVKDAISGLTKLNLRDNTPRMIEKL